MLSGAPVLHLVHRFVAMKPVTPLRALVGAGLKPVTPLRALVGAGLKPVTPLRALVGAGLKPMTPLLGENVGFSGVLGSQW